ncbi:nuclear transport factor 2 family protein [Kitasatospora sp. NPDC085895]|uniref:nuclear transport factor 2 family protein n=1 Tax=Kitasatospora sp. NPDC085895 TaxID=3155057 RepID=UPI00344D36FC
MSDCDAFLRWVRTTLYKAQAALYDGDVALYRALWSRRNPVSVLGTEHSADGRCEVDEHLTALARRFSDCTSYEFEALACNAIGDIAYTVGLEYVSASIEGQPRTYVLRATQVYRCEDGGWRIAHRHEDTPAAG